jgi:hypothetical protein
VYSLVSPCELATALVRHRTAVEVTDVLDRALRIDRTELARLSLAYRDDVRRQTAWSRVAAQAGLAVSAEGALVGTPHGGTAAAAEEGPGSGPGSVSVSVPGLDLAKLLDFVREEVLGWTREQVGELVVQTESGGVTVVADALGAAWAGAELPGVDRDRLDVPWRTVYGEMPAVAAPDDFGGHAAEVRALLDTLSTASPVALAQLGEAYRLQAPPRPSGVRPWDVAMRRACQSAFVTGKVRHVAAAHLAAVRAQLLPGLPAGLPGTAAGDAVAHAVAGTVQAVAMRDTLDPVVYRFLVFAWDATLRGLPG